MITRYEVINVLLANEHSKARKIKKLKTLDLTDSQIDTYLVEILDGEDFNIVMSRAEEDEKMHWTTLFGKRAAADLLTLGKVQPENMLDMSSLPEDDFKNAIKIATSTARKMNEDTIAAETELNNDIVPDYLL